MTFSPKIKDVFYAHTHDIIMQYIIIQNIITQNIITQYIFYREFWWIEIHNLAFDTISKRVRP